MKRRKTKIVATLGPATVGEGGIRSLLAAGVDVVRVNCSHGSQDERGSWMTTVRREASRLGRPVALLVDLMGPRIRVGDLESPLALVEGQEVVFVPLEEAAPGEIPTTYAALASDVVPGNRILLADGVLETEVVETATPRVRARVVHGGELRSRKGINLPGVRVSAPALTDKDLTDLEHALEYEADYLALSFVRQAQDLETLRRHVHDGVRLIAKIEKDAAVEAIEEVLAVSDGIMVARGDLGVELPFERVPLVQKHLIDRAVVHAKPVITATQMLESMVQSPRPTRAEASDVANAILDGTDAVMLSAETAIGRHPVAAVKAMDRIIRSVERDSAPRQVPRTPSPDQVLAEDAIAAATTKAAQMLHSPLIVTFTADGFTARKVAAYRPPTPILGLTPNPATYRRLALIRGVHPHLVAAAPDYEAMLEVAREAILTGNYAAPGDSIVVTAGLPWEASPVTNLLKVETV